MGTLDAIARSNIYLDANLFIYHLEGFAEFATILNRLFEKLDNGEAHGVTSELTLAETLVKPLQQGNALVCSTYEQFLRDSKALSVVPVSRQILIKAAELRASSAMKLPDAIHFATAAEQGCSAYVTNDKRVKSLPTMPVLPLSELT